jgi:uncharacterized membrane protein HdeD (DUF308 family)
MRIGGVFIALGAVALVLPTWATLAGELLIAWMLVLWGAIGLWFAWEMRPSKEWRYAGVMFGITLFLGLVFSLFPGFGIETLTIILMMIFLFEGVISVLLGLRLSARFRNWGWMVFSGLCSLAIGVIILIGWPETAVWAIGMLMGANFLSTGLALIMLGKMAKDYS